MRRNSRFTAVSAVCCMDAIRMPAATSNASYVSPRPPLRTKIVKSFSTRQRCNLFCEGSRTRTVRERFYSTTINTIITTTTTSTATFESFFFFSSTLFFLCHTYSYCFSGCLLHFSCFFLLSSFFTLFFLFFRFFSSPFFSVNVLTYLHI